MSSFTPEEVARHDILVALGQNISKRRKERKLSQLGLAQKCGIPRPCISDLECGKRNASVLTLVTVAAALGTSVSAMTDAIELHRPSEADAKTLRF